MPEKPTIEQLRAIAHRYNLHLSDADLESFRSLMSATFESYRRIDQLPEPALPVHYARTGGYRPTADENPLNAWYQKCSIKGAASGPLAGKRIAIKDNVCVAGVPMMNGSVVLEGYIPEFDATIVTRILDAGGEIVGKAVCESLCFSGSSFTADTGPIATTTADVALLLEVIAGEDGLDPRQKAIKPDAYTSALRNDTEGIRIGIVREGFGWPELSERDVDEQVEAAARRFSKIGSQVHTLSVPMHRDGKHIWNAIKVEGSAMLMVRGNSMGTNWKGHYSVSLLDAYARGRVSMADHFFETLKFAVLLGEYMQDRYHGRYYAKAQNLARTLTRAYDDALQNVDLLVMPTTPMKAPLLPPGDATLAEKVARASGMNGGLNANNCPFNVTGHPVMTVPCGLSGGLPIGMMLVGRRGEDATVLRAAHAFEQISGYTVRPKPLSALPNQY